MTLVVKARVETTQGRKYVAQLLKHWSHNLAVTETPEGGTVTFPRDSRGADWPADGLVIFRADEQAIDVRIEASSSGQREGLEGAVARHIDRFAFREAPLRYDWRESE
ncbi:DUF2218 domain-containing protein [Sphingomonas ginkgonis]|uniref:DUF2218 domain-containing protein n=1 Tax=Sphingomonas ginkgonis TaxID=2315330 RepID=A0A429V9I7_9SPHN|nr:DUF2218 domain-containing protein [Sphingomonas ginkgonis]RST30653.1 DUF2218 domain-containing protein [Sphingomonas ginkgonis]